jgi:bacterioferritin-associated ferredoxin
MYVCICKAVSQGTVSQAIAKGATTIDAVGAATGAGTDCGSCRKSIARELTRSCATRDCVAEGNPPTR